MRGRMLVRLPHLFSVYQPPVDIISCLLGCGCFQVGCIGTVSGLGESKSHEKAAIQEAFNHAPLLLTSERRQHGYDWEVSHDRVLILEVVEQPKPLGGQVLAYDGHPEIATSRSTVLLGQGKAIEPGRISASPSFFQEILPFFRWNAACGPVGSAELTTVVKESLIVILGLQWGDITRDERVKVIQVGREAWGK